MRLVYDLTANDNQNPLKAALSLRHREDCEKLPYLQQNRGDYPFCDTIRPWSKLVLGY